MKTLEVENLENTVPIKLGKKEKEQNTTVGLNASYARLADFSHPSYLAGRWTF